MNSTPELALALRLLSDIWDEAAPRIRAHYQANGVLNAMPDLSLEAAQARAAAAQATLARLEPLLDADLPIEISLALRQSRHRLRAVAREADWYWLVTDVGGGGFFGLFSAGAYCGGMVLNALVQAAGRITFERRGDLDRYLGFLADYARIIDQMAARTTGQAERGIRAPKAQLPSQRATVAAFRARSGVELAVADVRLPAQFDPARAGFHAQVRRRLDELVLPAFDRLAAVLSPEYEALAPERVGMGQYPGGAEVYAELVKIHTTTELSPEQVHEVGLRRMRGIQADMRAIRDAVGLADDPAGYLARLAADPRFNADTVEGVKAVFQRYIDRMDAVFDGVFARRPKAPHGIKPMAEALEAGMTFGYYAPAREGAAAGSDDASGLFNFNARNLRRQPLFNIGALTYHELVPGHHLHLASQNEDELLHPIARYCLVGAFNEGWAEYAATLAGELGLYAEPEERYGRLVMDAFLTSRLVVDTGMNVMGWSLEQARDYMRANSSMSEAEVASESLRYSCDLPAQALAYKLGDTEILRLRDEMRQALGARFDLREFHAAVLGSGALPLPDLAWKLRQVARDRLAETA